MKSKKKLKQCNAVLPGGQEDAALMGRLRKPFNPLTRKFNFKKYAPKSHKPENWKRKSQKSGREL